MNIRIQSGWLDLSIEQGKDRLHELLAFASRQNNQRGFLFISKVLGKHWPVRPSNLRSIYDQLSAAIELDGPTWLFGLAETATGLGAGIADSLARAYPEYSIYYQHTTRHQIQAPIWFQIEENHSHAVAHLIYQPLPEFSHALAHCRHLILVDDEISTGRTLLQLARALYQRLNIQRITVISLVNWLADSSDWQDLPVRFIQLIKGRFSFQPDPHFKTQLPAQTQTGLCRLNSRHDLGRRGLKMPFEFNEYPRSNAAKISLLGTGEHLYIPFLIAEQWEKQGIDVLFQSTTRSPILLGDAIQRKIQFKVEQNRLNFVYNLPDDRPYHLIHESPEIAAHNHWLKGQFKDEYFIH